MNGVSPLIRQSLVTIFCLLLGYDAVTQITSANKILSKQGLSKAQKQAIQDVLTRFPNESQMSIAIIEGDQSAFYGLKKQNDTLAIVDNAKSVFEIGSITKVFTTHLLINAINDGLIESIDEPIETFCPYKIKGDPNITFKHLVNHTSGLPGNISASIFTTKPSNPYKNWDEEKLSKYLRQEVAILSRPGEQYRYSNVGMAILANMLGQFKQETYEDLLQKDIFLPLKMTSSTTVRADVQGELVQAYNWKGKKTDNWDLASLVGTGGVLSTATDLSRYIQWSFGALANELALMSQSTFKVDQVLEVALGWHLIKGYTKTPLLWHNGGTGGYKSSMALDIVSKSGVVILTNIGATNNPQKGLIDKLCYQLMATTE